MLAQVGATYGSLFPSETDLPFLRELSSIFPICMTKISAGDNRERRGWRRIPLRKINWINFPMQVPDRFESETIPLSKE